MPPTGPGLRSIFLSPIGKFCETLLSSNSFIALPGVAKVSSSVTAKLSSA